MSVERYTHRKEHPSPMNHAKYIGMDVHKETISIAVMDSAGKLVMELRPQVVHVQYRRDLRKLRMRMPSPPINCFTRALPLAVAYALSLSLWATPFCSMPMPDFVLHRRA